jgi:Uma2 family endonuclease
MQLQEQPRQAQPHLFTVEQYLALPIDERTELLGGVIFDVSPRNQPHRFAVARLTVILARGLDPNAYFVQSQDSVAVPDWRGNDAPEADVAVLRTREDYGLVPTSADAVALFEVSHTTYADDRGYKIPLYVRNGVPAYIVHLPKRQVERYATITDLELAHGQVFGESEAFDVLGVTIHVASLLLKS